MSLFKVQATFAPSLLDKGISSMMGVIKGWKNGITQEELDIQKTMAIGQRKVSFDSESNLVNTIHMHNVSGSLHMLGEYENMVNKVTLNDVHRSMKHINLDKCTLVRAGTF